MMALELIGKRFLCFRLIGLLGAKRIWNKGKVFAFITSYKYTQIS